MHQVGFIYKIIQDARSIKHKIVRIKVTFRRIHKPLFLWNSKVSHILSVSVTSVIQHAKCMHCLILTSVDCPTLPDFSTLYLINGISRKKKKVTGHKICVLTSTTFVGQISHSNINSVRYDHKCTFFFLMPPHVHMNFRGPPSWLWRKCNRLLRLGRPWGAVTLSR